MPSSDKDILTLYAELLHDHRQQILSYCWSHSTDLTDADILLVSITNALLRSIGTLRRDSTPRQRHRWLQRVMHHAYIDHRATRPHSVPLTKAGAIAVESDEDTLLVEALLEHLTDDDRAFLQQRFHGYSPHEQALHYGVSDGAIHQRYHRIILKLRDIYNKYYA
ncbi:MAG: hypothetical protein J6X79_03475 [Bacteroidales bacterium]|nr:hypothetical protein [Bacteroidales bacterium]